MVVKLVSASLLFFTMAAFKTAPLLFHASTHIPSDPGDPLLNTWILAWDFHALTTDPRNLFNANILYPTEMTLALSEHMLGVLPLFAPIYALTGNPVLAYNFVFFLSFPLSAITMFLLIHHWTQHFSASLVAGFLFGFALLRFDHISHLQLLNLFWAPLALLFVEKFLRWKRWRDLIAFAMFYWLQVLSSVYLGWFITISVLLYVVYYICKIDRGLLSRSMIPRYAAFISFSLMVLLPPHFPYYVLHQQWGLSRSLAECELLSADLFLSYLSPPLFLNDLYLSLLHLVQPSFGAGEKRLFPGMLMIILVMLSMLPYRGFIASNRLKQMRQVFLFLMASSFVLSLGPSLVILDSNTYIPLPYRLLYYAVPGFKAMRVPSRFAFLVMLAASALAAIGFLRACHHLRARPGFRALPSMVREGILACLIIGLSALELGGKPLPLVKVPTGGEVPEVYRWLAMRPFDGAIVEIPFYGDYRDQIYTYLSTYHWSPILNGASGFMPPLHTQTSALVKALPSQKSLESLSAIGVQGIILHTDRLEPNEAVRWHKANLPETGLEKVAEFGFDIVYKIPMVKRGQN